MQQAMATFKKTLLYVHVVMFPGTYPNQGPKLINPRKGFEHNLSQGRFFHLG